MINKILLKNNVWFLMSIVAVLLASESCSRKTNFLTSTEVPAAQGDVKVTKSSNNNFEIKISIMHLADQTDLNLQRKHT